MNQGVIAGRNALTPVMNRDDAIGEWHHPNPGKATILVGNYNARGHYNEKLIPNLDLQRPCHDYNAGNLSCNAQVFVKIPNAFIIKPETTTAMPIMSP